MDRIKLKLISEVLAESLREPEICVGFLAFNYWVVGISVVTHLKEIGAIKSLCEEIPESVNSAFGGQNQILD